MEKENTHTIATQDYISLIEDKLKSIPLETWIGFIVVFLVTSLAYLYYGFTPILDKESYGPLANRMESMASNYAGAARPLFWYLSSRIGTGSFLPLFNLVIACLNLSVTAYLFALIIGASRIGEKVFLALLFSTVPFWGPAVSLHQWNLALSTSFLTAILGLYLIHKGYGWKWSALLVFLTLTNYQTSIGLFTSTLVALCFVAVVSNKSIREILSEKKELIVNGTKALVVGVLAYLPVYVFMTANSSNTYTEVQNEKVSSLLDIFSNLSHILSFNVHRLFAKPFFHKDIWVIFVGVLFLSLLTLFICNGMKRGAGKVPLFCLMVVLLIISCFPIHIILKNSFYSPRISVALAVVIVVFYAIPLLLSKLAIIRNVIFILGAITLVTFLQFHNVSSFSQQMTNLHNLSLGIRIADRIEMNENYDKEQTYYLITPGAKSQRIYAAGARAFRTPMLTNVYDDKFKWYLQNYFRIIGLENVIFDYHTDKHLKLSENIIKNMPVWPAEGSVKFVRFNRIIINF